MGAALPGEAVNPTTKTMSNGKASIPIDQIIERLGNGPVTADAIAAVLEIHWPSDAVTRLRGRKGLRVTVVGTVPRSANRPGPAKKLYRIEKADAVPIVPDCCGYCRLERIGRESQ